MATKGLTNGSPAPLADLAPISTAEETNGLPPQKAPSSIHAIVSHYETIIKALPSPPILMGHSFGGLFVQLLLIKGLGKAGVGIMSRATEGCIGIEIDELY